MYLGIAIILIGIVLGVIIGIKLSPDKGWMSGITVFIVGIIGMIIMFQPAQSPQDIPYYVTVGDKTAYFDNYTWADNSHLVIPSHYYMQISWLNSYKYCDTPITIVVPEGQKIIINDLSPKTKPYIVGGCK